MVQGLTEKTVGPDKGAAAAMPTGGNRQRRFFDEHGLDAGLAGPCRKIHRGDTLKKQRWFRHGGRSVGIGSADETGKVGRIGSGCWRWVWTGWIVQGSTRKTAGLDTGAVAARGTVSADSAAQICAAAGSSGKIGSADFSTNMGWTMDCPGQAGKFVEGTR